MPIERAGSRPQIWVLRRLLLKLLLRGPTAHWATLREVPTSSTRLAAGGLLFALMGLFAGFFHRLPHHDLALVLHTATLVLIGLYLINASGETLGGRHEAMLLSFRPVSRRTIVLAKAMVMAQVAICMAVALNLTGLVVGAMVADGGWSFVVAHALSMAVNVMFCLGCTLWLHEVRCFRWIRKALALALIVYLATAVAIIHWDVRSVQNQVLHGVGWAAYLFPPAWFAGLGEVLMGGGRNDWALGILALAATGVVGWLALLSGTGRGGAGMDAPIRSPDRRLRRGDSVLAWLKRSRIADWGLSAPAQASFALASSYLVRSRELQFRLLSGLSPILLMPLVVLLPGHGRGLFGAFSTAFTGAYLGVAAFFAIYLIETSSDWRAARLFRTLPLYGPTELLIGARRAVLVLCVPPMVVFYGGLVWWLTGEVAAMVLLVPGVLAVPLLAYVPNLQGVGLPCSCAPDDSRGMLPMQVLGYMSIALLIFAGLATWLHGRGFFWPLMAVEVLGILGAHLATQRRFKVMRWSGSAV